MRKPGSKQFRHQAPLASFESFLSLETTDTETQRLETEMRELHWNINNNLNSQHHQQQQQATTQLPGADRMMDEPWLSSEFSQMTRKQQNCEIYRVVSAAVLSMSTEVAVAKKRLAELLKRREEIQRELQEAQMNGNQEPLVRLLNSRSCTHMRISISGGHRQ